MESTVASVTGAGTEAEITTRTFDPTYAAVSPPRCAWVRSDLGREALQDCSRFYSNNLHQDKLHRLLQLRGREYPMSWTRMNARAVERMSKRQSCECVTKRTLPSVPLWTNTWEPLFTTRQTKYRKSRITPTNNSNHCPRPLQ